MKILPINFIFKKSRFSSNRSVVLPHKNDFLTFKSNPNIDDKLLKDRKILPENKNIDEFFAKISNKIFKDDPTDKAKFIKYLKEGKISLSSSAYNNLKHPQSAVALKLNSKNSTAKNLSILNDHINLLEGIGINFSNFDEPVEAINQINNFFKYKEQKVNRPPAGIALLDINHPKILDFIKLKDNADYSDWCFDLSVIINDDFFEKLKKNDIKTHKIYSALLDSMLKSGEPGIIFSNDKNYICDCCATAQLKENKTLTLGQINLSKFVYEDKINYIDLKNAANILNKAVKKLDKNSYISILGYQDLLDKLNLKYSSAASDEILINCIKTIQSTGANVALSPTGTVSRILKTTPSINPNQNISYEDEIKTAAAAQKQINQDKGMGQISKTIILDKNANQKDIDNIIKFAHQSGLKGICVFKKQ